MPSRDPSDVQERINQLIEENREKQKELKEKNAEIREVTREIDRIHSSTSWKITRPVRKIGPAIRSYMRLIRNLRNGFYAIARTNGSYLFIYRAIGFIVRRTIPRYSPRFTSRETHEILKIKKAYTLDIRAVTVIIPSYNDYELLAKCLSSINRTVDSSRVDIVIVDDASSDQAHIDFLESIDQKNVRVIFKQENGGFAKTVNVGLKSAESGDVVILNSDTTAKKLWLESLQYAAYLDEKTGIVGPKLLYPDGSIQHAGLHRNLGAPEWFDHYYRFKPSWYAPANVPNYVIGVTGACMYIKREVIQKTGYLDERYPMEFEDLDYCLRAWDEGFRSYYYPMAVLTHHESGTRDTKKGTREKESQRYFWEKWGDWFDGRNVLNEEGKTRIIYVLQSTAVGGGHRIVFEHLNWLQKLGFDVELYALEGQPGWFPLNVEVKKFENYQQLVSALEKEEAIKVATWWETMEPVWLASIKKGIPVFFVQDIESSYYKDDQYMQQFVLSKYRYEFKYFTTSGVNERALMDMGVKPEVIPCGIDLEIFKPTKDDREKNVLLSVGRGHYLKNLAMTMDAWKGITSNQPALWMYGIEPHLAEGLENVEYFDRPSDAEVNILYNRATVFIQSSIHEGFCLPILEAMAAGAPVICTDAHGNADFCEDEKNCLMVEQGDVDGLRAAVVRLFSDEHLQERLRQEGYKTASEYSWPVVMMQVKEFYQGISGISPEVHESVLLEAQD